MKDEPKQPSPDWSGRRKAVAAAMEVAKRTEPRKAGLNILLSGESKSDFTAKTCLVLHGIALRNIIPVAAEKWMWKKPRAPEKENPQNKLTH